MGEINLSEIFQRLQASGMPSDFSQIAEYMRSLGISGEDPNAVQNVLKQMGLDSQDGLGKEDIISMINMLTTGLGSEERRQFSGLIEDTVRQLGCEELPQDIREFLEEWKRS